MSTSVELRDRLRADRGVSSGLVYRSVAAAVALVLGTAGCGGERPGAAVQLEDDPRQEDFAGRVLDDCPPTPETGPGKATYAVDNMTRKLQDFPELAARAGLAAVTTCEEAAAYVKAYRELYAERPDFESVGKIERPPGTPRPPLPRLKILGGTKLFDSRFPTAPNPIVRIKQVVWKPDATTGGYNAHCEEVQACSGTFIAKNWILTAAHCLQAAHLQKAENQPAKSCPDGGAASLPKLSDVKWRGDANWLVNWSVVPDATTGPPGPSVFTMNFTLRQLPHPNFKGLAGPDGTTMKDNFDVALLYLPISDGNDKLLPPDASRGGAAMLISNMVPLATEHQVGGWGLPANPPELRSGTAPIISRVGSASFAATTGSAWNGVAPCGGDSGGPLYREEQLSGINAAKVIVGVASGFKKGLTFAPATECPGTTPGTIDTFYWTRVESVLGWIKTTMNEQYGTDRFECRRETQTPSFYRCWGEPCRKDQDCTGGKTCWGAASRYSDCFADICGGGCACIVGQCILPRKTK